MSGAVVNVVAMLTGNSSGMVSSFGTGSEAAQKFKEQYERTTAAVGEGSKAMADAMAKEAAAAQAAADKSIAAIESTRQAAQTAAAQAAVAADKTEAAQAKAAAAATAASNLQIKAAETGAAADVEAADIAASAAGRAANAARLAAEIQATAFAKAGDAALAEAGAVAESTKLQEAALAKAAAAAEAAAVKRNSSDLMASAGVQKASLASVAALAVIGGASVEMAAKFEKSTTLLVTAGGETKDNLNMVRDGILNVAQSTGVSAEQLSEGMYTVEKATFRGAAGLDVLKAAAQGAAAENVDMGTMTNALTSIMMSYHLQSDKAVATTNELVAGAGAAKTTMQEYAGSLSTVLPVASAAGISFEQVGGAIATLTQHGTSAAESTQELANTIRALQAPNNVAVSAMQQLGIDAQDVAANLGTRGLTGTISLVTDAISNHLGPEGLVMVDTMKKSATGVADLNTMMNQMSPQLRASAQGFLDGTVTAKQFATETKGLGAEGDAQGKQFASLAVTVSGYNDQIKHGGPAAQTAAAALKAIMGGATGMNTALMLGGENMATFKEKTEEMSAAAQQSGTDLSTNADTQATLAATTARLKQEFEALMIMLGTMLIPVVKNMMDGIMGLVGWMKENKGAAEAMGAGILTIVAAMTAWSLVSKAIEMGWVAIAVLAIAALVAAFVWAYNNIGWFKDGVDAAMKWVGEAVHNVIDWIVNTAVPALIKGWQDVVSFFTTSVGMFKDFGTNTYGMFKDFVDNTVGMFRDFESNTKGMFKDLFSNTKGMISDWSSNTKGMFDDWGKKVSEGWAGYWKDPLGETDKFFEATKKGFQKWNTDTSKSITDWKDDTTKSFQTWNKEASKNTTDWLTQSATDFQTWNEGTSKKVTDWKDNTGKDLKTWNEGASKNVTDWLTKSKDDFKTWNADTSASLTTWIDNSTKGFQKWNQEASKNISEGWAGYWKDPIGETETFFTTTDKGFQTWNDGITTTLKDWHDKTLEGFQGWNKDASKSLNDWIGSTTEGFKGWNKDTSKNVTDWIGTTTEGFKGWNQDASKALTNWLTGSKDDFQTWNKDTSKSVTDSNDNKTQSFAEWNQKTSQDLTGWATNQDGGFREWNRNTSGMVKDFAGNTGGMINDWGNNTNGMFNDWHNNLTGKTRSTVDDIHDSIFQFNQNTIGMFTDFTNNTRGMFDDMFKHIGDGWHGLQDAAAGPVGFIVNTVYNDGIKTAWNAVNSGLGLGLALPDAHFASGGVAGHSGAPGGGGGMKHFATGGIMPGWSPGVDNHVIAVGGGEAIMRPEWTQAVGAEKVHAMNAMARSGNMGGIKNMMGFADGGIVGNIASFFSNPLGGLQDAMKPFSSMLGQTSGGNWGQMMNQFPSHVIKSLGDKIGGLFSAAHPSGGGDGGHVDAGSAGAGVQQWAGLVSQALSMMGQPADLLGTTLRRMNQESGGNSAAINLTDSNAMAGIPSKGLMQVIDPTFAANAMPGYNSDIYDPLSNILASMHYAIGRYGSLAGAYNQAGGYASGGVVPVFDQGGWIPPGRSIIDNRTGAPELLKNATPGSGGGSLDGQAIEIVIPELGGRLTGYIKAQQAQLVSNLNRSLQGSAGVSAGGI